MEPVYLVGKTITNDGIFAVVKNVAKGTYFIADVATEHPICDHTFNDKLELKNHIQTKHNDADLCPQCSIEGVIGAKLTHEEISKAVKSPLTMTYKGRVYELWTVVLRTSRAGYYIRVDEDKKIVYLVYNPFHAGTRKLIPKREGEDESEYLKRLVYQFLELVSQFEKSPTLLKKFKSEFSFDMYDAFTEYVIKYMTKNQDIPWRASFGRLYDSIDFSVLPRNFNEVYKKHNGMGGIYDDLFDGPATLRLFMEYVERGLEIPFFISLLNAENLGLKLEEPSEDEESFFIERIGKSSAFPPIFVNGVPQDLYLMNAMLPIQAFSNGRELASDVMRSMNDQLPLRSDEQIKGELLSIMGRHSGIDYDMYVKRFDQGDPLSVSCVKLIRDLIHWSGGPTKLKRKQEGFGDYSYEELVVQLGTAITCMKFGLDYSVLSKDIAGESYKWVEYISSHKKKRDFITRAAKDAMKAFRYLVL